MQSHFSDRFHRHFIRLRGYDYSQPGEYFITLAPINVKLFSGKS
jgi:hypothetical protein